MKHVKLILLSTILSLALLVPAAAPAMAAAESDAEPTLVRPALGIRVPRMAEVKTPVTMMVVEKHTHRPVAGADVYAIKANTLEQLNTNTTNQDFLAILDKYVAIAQEDGLQIGTTDNEGKLVYEFPEIGRYILVAIKDNFIPGFARISIVETLPNALRIRAPYRAEVGKPVKIGVYVKFSPTPRPVPDADIYALKLDDNNTEASTSIVRPDSLSNEVVEKYAKAVREHGFKFGTTGNDGIAIGKFPEVGRYILIAVKDDFIPGFARISVVPAGQKQLLIRAPYTAPVERPVVITVYEALTLQAASPTQSSVTVIGNVAPAPVQAKPVAVAEAKPTLTAEKPQATQSQTVGPVKEINAVPVRRYKPVPEARVFAVPLEDLAPDEIEKLNALSADEAEKYVADTSRRTYYIGKTNENGQVRHKFEDTGRYVLIAVKNGYRHGRSKIGIVKPDLKAMHIRAPQLARIKQTVVMLVTERPVVRPLPQLTPDTSGDDNVTSATQKAQAEVEASPIDPIPVPDAMVYAILMNGDSLPDISDVASDSSANAAIEKYIALATDRGIKIGLTDENGKVSHEFERPGRYLLLSVKDGFIPGFAKIGIVALEAEETKPYKIDDKPTTSNTE